jgi:hypothetical protein
MAKQNKDNGNTADNAVNTEAVAAPAQGTNHTLVYRRDHPQNRCSYGISGVSGIVVFDKNFFPDGVPPATITVDCVLADPKPDTKALKAELAAQRAIERAAKAEARIEAAKAKAEEKATKAAEALKAALARAEAAKADAAKVDAPPAE